jgi:hypothetical protein
MAAGLLPRMGLMSELFGAKASNERSSPSPRSDSKSMCSLSASEDEADQPLPKAKQDPPKSGADQPLDLSNKGSSPSASPWSQGAFAKHCDFSLAAAASRFLSDENESSSNDDDGHFVCDKDKCDKSFTKRSSLARHKFEHSGNFFVATIAKVAEIFCPNQLTVLKKSTRVQNFIPGYIKFQSGCKPPF